MTAKARSKRDCLAAHARIRRCFSFLAVNLHPASSGVTQRLHQAASSVQFNGMGNSRGSQSSTRFGLVECALLLLLLLASPAFLPAQQNEPALQLSRTVRTWEFLPVVGTRAGLVGDESGRLEVWGYPLKIFREMH